MSAPSTIARARRNPPWEASLKMGSRRAILAAILGLFLFVPVTALAVSLTLEGAGTGVSVGTAQALYASNAAGQQVSVVAVGQRAPNGGKVTELGVPSMMPDGRVLFGAEVSRQGEKGSTDRVGWGIYIGDPEAPADRRIAPALDVKSKPP